MATRGRFGDRYYRGVSFPAKAQLKNGSPGLAFRLACQLSQSASKKSLGRKSRIRLQLPHWPRHEAKRSLSAFQESHRDPDARLPCRATMVAGELGTLTIRK